MLSGVCLSHDPSVLLAISGVKVSQLFMKINGYPSQQCSKNRRLGASHQAATAIYLGRLKEVVWRKNWTLIGQIGDYSVKLPNSPDAAWKTLILYLLQEAEKK